MKNDGVLGRNAYLYRLSGAKPRAEGIELASADTHLLPTSLNHEIGFGPADLFHRAAERQKPALDIVAAAAGTAGHPASRVDLAAESHLRGID